MKFAILPVVIGLALTLFSAQAAAQFGVMTTLDSYGGPSFGESGDMFRF